MQSRQVTARWAGVVYFIFMLFGLYSEFLLPRFVVPGDAQATAANITGAEMTYRMGILIGLATHVLFPILVVILYKLLQEVDQPTAMLMVIFVAVGVAVAIANMLNRFAPLHLLSGADYLAAFPRNQLDALALSSLGVRTGAAAVPLAFWGLWLFPFGILVMKSAFLPRILGVLLLVAGLAYVMTSCISIVLPAHRLAATKVLMPFYLGEVPIIFWLLLKGAKVQQR